ncbi:hypothetical protein TNCV_2132391 [Trichonephila clavipes]|nr:hypothetical protein TNCV_2132391 [Trichonephila clavipes]
MLKHTTKGEDSMYKEGDLVATQRTQFRTGLKLRPKFLVLYKITKVNSRDKYEAKKNSIYLSTLVRAEKPTESEEGDFVEYPVCKRLDSIHLKEGRQFNPNSIPQQRLLAHLLKRQHPPLLAEFH